MAIDITEDLEQDLIPDDEKLKAITVLAEKQLELESEVADLESKLSEKAKELREIAEGKLPAAMKAAHIEELKLTNGAKLKLDEGLKISVPKTKMDFVCNWLKKHKHDDIIKREIVVELPKGTDPSLVKQAQAAIKKLKLAFSTEQNVHSGTLKALIKEQREAGKFKEKLEDFGAFEYTLAKITLPKNKGEN